MLTCTHVSTVILFTHMSTNPIITPAQVRDMLSQWGYPDSICGEVEKLLTPRAPGKREAAVEWLKVTLANGPVPATRVQSEAKAAGITLDAIRRAKKELGIKPRQTARVWLWELPNG